MRDRVIRAQTAAHIACPEQLVTAKKLSKDTYLISGCGRSATYRCTGGGQGLQSVAPWQAKSASALPGPLQPSFDNPFCVKIDADAAETASLSCPEGMSLLPAGNFVSVPGSERPPLAAFCIDTTEVTVEAYRACVKTGKCPGGKLRCGSAGEANYGAAGREKHPVNCVIWDDASGYCRWLDRRLPTEEEWEWAASSASPKTPYPWGEEAPADQLCWSGQEGRTQSCPVGTFTSGATRQGALDLAGNVWEWTAGHGLDNTRIARGSAWSSKTFRIADAYSVPPEQRSPTVGFRCVTTPAGAITPTAPATSTTPAGSAAPAGSAVPTGSPAPATSTAPAPSTAP